MKIIVPWHRRSRLEAFLEAWAVSEDDDRFIFMGPESGSCPEAKNAGVRIAREAGAEFAGFLDDDCFPHSEAPTVEAWMNGHLDALRPAESGEFMAITDPPSRGTPFFNLTVTREVTCSMGFWTGVGDYDAVRQLVFGAEHPMTFRREVVFGRFFPLCGMNVVFKVSDYVDHPVDVGRMDDIWAGFEWQRRAYASGKCFNLAGPLVVHQRASEVWGNLRNEVERLHENETRWKNPPGLAGGGVPS